MTAATVAPPVHDLLLALAGRLDDDLLAWARELLAVGEEDQAVELVTAALAAERVVLPPTLRAALVAAARMAHADLDVDHALAPGAVEEGTRHRFDAAAAPDDAVVTVLTALPARRLTGCTLHLTWRKTPAGAAPGPLPRAVVLVEADPERSADVLAYLLATELDRAGAPASVEVFTAGRPLPAYHTAALRRARVVLGSRAERPQAPAREMTSGAAGRHGSVDATSLFLVPDSPSRSAGPDAGPSEDVRPDPTPSDAGRPDAGPSGVAGSRPAGLFGPDPAPPAAATEPPRPAGRRRRPEPAAEDGVPSGGSPDVPVNPPASGPPVPVGPALFGPDPFGPDPSPPAVAAPTFPGTLEPPPDTDPLNGPLRVPLLEPLLDPTGGDPSTFDPGVPGRAVRDRVVPDPERSGPAERGTRGADHAAPSEPVSSPGEPTPTPPGVTGPAAVPAEWEEEWRSGEWAMPHTPRPAPTGDRPGPDDVPGTPGGTDPAAADLPQRTERGRRRAEPDGGRVPPAGAVPPARPDGAPSAGPDGVSLFESPTTRVAPSPGPRPSPPVNGGGHAAPSDTGRHPAAGGLFPSVPGNGPNPLDRPSRAPGPRSAADDPIFGLGPPDVSLFGGSPDRESRAPERPAPDVPRSGRRRRPEEPPPGGPFSVADGQAVGHVPAPSRPGDDPEPSPLLHGTEGDLLAQLQAELAARERRPRPYRRAERNGSTHIVNGHGPDGDRPPPDRAS